MPVSDKDFEDFASEYEKEEREILALTSDMSGGAGKSQGDALWEAHHFFLACVDTGTNELRVGDGRIVWPLTDEDRNEDTWRHRFKKGSIYRLKARKLIDRTVPDGRLPSFFNRFLVVEVLDEDVQNDELLAVLAEYRKPVEFVDEVMGKFALDKDLELFNGKIDWLGKKISASLEVNANNKGSWTKAAKTLRALFGQREEKDAEFRAFAADRLTDLANDWRQEEEDAEISKKDFIGRISLSELSVTSGGNFTAYYDDDDMFGGHVIMVLGSLKKGVKSADIAG